jgi:hypothetical protein
VSKTQILLATSRVYETQDDARKANVVGPFLLRLSDEAYGMAVGNIINQAWTFEWAASTKTLYEERLLQPFPVPVDKVPATPGIPVLYSPEERIHLDNAYTKGFQPMLSSEGSVNGRKVA